MKKKSMFANLKKVFHYMDRRLPMVIFSFVLAFAAAILTTAGPDKVGQITDLIKNGLTGTIDMGAIAKIGILLIDIYMGSSLCTFIEHYVMASVTLDVSKELRSDLSEKINKVPMSYFDKASQGDILSRITNDVQTLQQGFSNSMPNIISSVSQFVGCLAMMLISEWRLALCVIGVTVIGIFIVLCVMKHSQRYFISRQENLGRLNGYIEEMYSGHEVLRISQAGDKSREKFKKLNDAVYDSNWKSQFFSGVMQPLMNVVGNVGYVVICVIGSILAMKGIINFGTIVSFMLYVRLFTAPLTQIAQGMANLQTASASAGRIFDFLNTEELSDESEKTAKIEKVKGEVIFENVKFSYPDNPENLIIRNFSAHIKPGQKCAVVGPTGAGKTTMVNLLMRFFEVNSGNIIIDGVPVSSMKRENVHELFSMVLQDTWIFDGTVRENLAYNIEGITDADLDRVCASCGLTHFIRTLPHGYDTHLSESTTISAGQKQMITIARAMLQNSPMLILDEATSSVDTRTEAVIQRAMDQLTKGRTSFVIAHRLSTIKNADMILVVKNGDVIESGNHEELMKKGGFYCELYNSQFENK